MPASHAGKRGMAPIYVSVVLSIVPRRASFVMTADAVCLSSSS